MTAAMRPDPSAKRDEPISRDAARYGNGVPQGLKAAGLSFVEMTGVTRPAWVRAACDRAETVATATNAVPDSLADAQQSEPMAVGSAAALFQGIINSITGEESARDLESTEASDEAAVEVALLREPEAEYQDPVEFEATESTAPDTPHERPRAAAFALAEAESLMHALSRAPEEAPMDDAQLDLLREALEAPPARFVAADVEFEETLYVVPDAAPESAVVDVIGEELPAPEETIEEVPAAEVSALEVSTAEMSATLPPLEDFAPTPLPAAAPQVTAPRAAQSLRPMSAEDVLTAAPGYTLLGRGPITWPGVPPQPSRAPRLAAYFLLAPATAAAVAGAWYVAQGWLQATPLALLYGALGLLAGGTVLALAALVIVRRTRDDGERILRGLSAVSKVLGVEVIGAVPLLRGLKPPLTTTQAPLWAGIPLLCGTTNATPLTEAFDTLRTNFRFAAPREGARTVCFVGAVPGDGLKTIAFNFAAAHAQRGQHVLFITEARAGVLDHVVRERMDVPNLYCTDAPATGEGYDLVVIAGQALLAAPEARHGAARADAVVLVMDTALTGREMALRAVALLRDVKAPLAGVVVNRVRSGSLRRAYARRADARPRSQEPPFK